VNEIVIRKDGKWYFNDAEMFRRNIVNVLAVNINKKEDGSYYIALGNETEDIDVEDVPFFATGLQETEAGTIKLVFHDLQEFELTREQRLYFKGDVPYITYRWPGDTRLSRGIYWKLSDYFDFRGDEVYIVPPGCVNE
jgi:hypothetical protein